MNSALRAGNTLDERPDCFGLGRDLDSRQWVPVERCQRCPDVIACALLRLARQAESNPRVRHDTFEWSRGIG